MEAVARSADRYLYKKEAGGYRLNTDFHELKFDMGRMFGFSWRRMCSMSQLALISRLSASSRRETRMVRPLTLWIHRRVYRSRMAVLAGMSG